jgi:16S rRNA (adenine1518-N6/adenine1519-N6)-dimethyltransferase
MSLTARTKQLLQKHNLKPVHHRGQNFLIQNKILDKIINVAKLKKNDIVLEVGPGLGFLTEKLIKKTKKVVAVELDRNLVTILSEEFKDIKNLEIKEGNILKFSADDLGLRDKKYKIVANLPYNITSRFMRNFLEEAEKPDEMILMIQREVANRIVAGPGKMSMLSLSCQFYADCKVEFLVGKRNFLPAPKVDSAVIKLKIKKDLLCHSGLDPESKPLKYSQGSIDDKKLFKIAKIGFSSKRKKLIGNLSKGLKINKDELKKIFKKIGISGDVRSQELGVNDWIRLCENI